MGGKAEGKNKRGKLSLGGRVSEKKREILFHFYFNDFFFLFSRSRANILMKNIFR